MKNNVDKIKMEGYHALAIMQSCIIIDNIMFARLYIAYALATIELLTLIFSHKVYIIVFINDYGIL